MSPDLDERYGRTDRGGRRLGLLGLGLLGGGAVGVLGVGGFMLLVTAGDALADGGSVGTGLVVSFFAAVIGGVLGATSGACALALAWSAGAIARGTFRRVVMVLAAAVGGGVSTYVLIEVADLLPDVPGLVPPVVSVLAAVLDALVAVVLPRVPRRFERSGSA